MADTQAERRRSRRQVQSSSSTQRRVVKTAEGAGRFRKTCVADADEYGRGPTVMPMRRDKGGRQAKQM